MIHRERNRCKSSWKGDSIGCFLLLVLESIKQKCLRFIQSIVIGSFDWNGAHFSITPSTYIQWLRMGVCVRIQIKPFRLPFSFQMSQLMKTKRYEQKLSSVFERRSQFLYRNLFIIKAEQHHKYSIRCSIAAAQCQFRLECAKRVYLSSTK